MAQGNSRGLELPTQSKPGKESFDMRPRKVSGWVASLPVANLGETARMVYQALHDANRHHHSWKKRYHFLEAIREPLQLIQQSLSTRYTGQGLPLPPKTQQIATLSQRLYTEMAIGYKAAIEDMLDASFLFQSRRALKLMTHRASRYLSLGILTSYQVYTQQPEGLWQELHTLYRFAEERDFHQDSIRDHHCPELPKSSIARIYKQILLLATTSPFRLRQGEAAAIYRALSRWSAHAQLLSAKEEGAAQALFVIHLESDDEPDYHAFDARPCQGATCRLLGTRQLVKLLEEERQHSSESPNPLLTAELYERLIHIWGATPKRGEHRMDGKQQMEAVVGMTRIHNLLSPALHDEKPESHRAHFESRAVPVIEMPNTSSDDVWNIYTAKNYATIPASELSSSQETAAPQPASADVEQWGVRNESPGGYRLSIPEENSSGVRVGELIALREGGSRNRWQLAVVRWMRRFAHTGLEAGVQLLAPQMVAVMLKNRTRGKVKSEQQRGLLLPAISEHGQPATLLTPCRLFHSAERVLIHTPRNEIEVTLGNSIQDSGTFVQFEFSTGQTSTPASHDEPAAGRTDAPYDRLWGQL